MPHPKIAELSEHYQWIYNNIPDENQEYIDSFSEDGTTLAELEKALDEECHWHFISVHTPR
jgi:hypothetical protein